MLARIGRMSCVWTAVAKEDRFEMTRRTDDLSMISPLLGSHQ